VGKSKRVIDDALRLYAKRIGKCFPTAETETIYKPGDGHDAWVNIKMPVESSEDREAKLRQIIKLDNDLWNETGVSVVGLIVTKEPEGARNG
jgi:hypothetical protein